MKEFHAIVSGRVQSVMFRAFVHKHAQRLGVTGFVRNLADGSVEVVAQGSDATLKELIAYLHKGPFFSHASNIEVNWRETAGVFDSFEIEY